MRATRIAIHWFLTDNFISSRLVPTTVRGGFVVCVWIPALNKLTVEQLLTIIVSMNDFISNTALQFGRMATAAEVRAAVARTGITLKEISGKVDISLSVLSRKMRGSAPLSVEEIVAIALAIDVQPTELIETITEAVVEAEEAAVEDEA